jgi:hypothetical protein
LHGFGWGDESEGLAGSAVEFGSDGLEMLGVVDREVCALREVLTQ